MKVRDLGSIEIGYTPTNVSMRQMLEEALPLLRRTKDTNFSRLEDEDRAIKFLIAAWIGLGSPEMETIKLEPTGSVLSAGHQKIAVELILKTEEALQKLRREEMQ